MKALIKKITYTCTYAVHFSYLCVFHEMSSCTHPPFQCIGGRGGRRYYNGPPRGGGRAQQNQPPVYRYESDFDFETANAQFDREGLEEEFKRLRVSRDKGQEDDAMEEGQGGDEDELEEGEIMDEPSDYYDKSKSFFDNLGCDVSASSGSGRWVYSITQYEIIWVVPFYIHHTLVCSVCT